MGDFFKFFVAFSEYLNFNYFSIILSSKVGKKILTANSKLFHFRPWDKDRYMSPDIVAVNNLLKEDKIWNAVKHHMESYHTSQVKFVFSKKATKIDEIFTVDLTLTTRE